MLADDRPDHEHRTHDPQLTKAHIQGSAELAELVDHGGDSRNLRAMQVHEAGSGQC